MKPRHRADPAVRALKAGRIREALAELAPRVAADPQDPDTLFKAALAAQATNTKEGRTLAVEIMRDLAERAPTADVWYNLGVAEARYANVLQAGEAFSQSLQLRPGNVNALVALSAVQWQVGAPKAGMVLHDAALKVHQWHDPDQRWVISLIHLIRGNWLEGFDNYEARWEMPSFVAAQGRETLGLKTPPARWLGNRVGPDALLIYTEQGVGDALMGLRWVTLAAQAAGGRVVLEVHHQLARLLKANAQAIGDVLIVARGQPLPDGLAVHCPMFSIPNALRLNAPDRVPSPVIMPEPSTDNRAKGPNIPEDSGILTVGVQWAGNPDHQNDYDRSAPFDRFRELFRVEHCRFLSFQLEDAQANKLRGEWPASEALPTDAYVHPDVVDLRPWIADFADTAALVARCDLVITVDTALAHLAGVMGKRVWMMPPTAPEWRWGLANGQPRESTAWYPSMTLYRRGHYRAWAGVISRVKADLEALAAQHFPHSAKEATA